MSYLSYVFDRLPNSILIAHRTVFRQLVNRQHSWLTTHNCGIHRIVRISNRHFAHQKVEKHQIRRNQLHLGEFKN